MGSGSKGAARIVIGLVQAFKNSFSDNLLKAEPSQNELSNGRAQDREVLKICVKNLVTIFIY